MAACDSLLARGSSARRVFGAGTLAAFLDKVDGIGSAAGDGWSMSDKPGKLIFRPADLDGAVGLEADGRPAASSVEGCLAWAADC